MFGFDNYSNSRLSFEPAEFYEDNFSVDEFIQRKRQNVPLDVLRDDLGSYLKALRSSLIELINQDYGQFLNLSANLVGLDGRIQNIVKPLTRAQSDLFELVGVLNSILDQIKNEIKMQKLLRSTKIQLQFLIQANDTIHSAERALDNVPNEIETDLDFNNLKYACDEIAETKFLLEKCTHDQVSPLYQQLLLRLESSKAIILKKLSSILQIYTSMESTTVETRVIVKSILQIYTELNAEHEAEDCFVQKVLKPKCELILGRKGNIFSLLEDIEGFINVCPLFVTIESINLSWISKFDFISRAVFPHIFTIICKHFPHIWSPSNPEAFHSNWTRCENFILKLESTILFQEQLENYRNSDILREFLSKWQFPVYFQLRFHTLAIELETAFDEFTTPCSTQDFQLDSTRILIKVINQCWDREKIFIPQLAGRFLKATSLFISRYLNEIKREIESTTNEQQSSNNNLQELIKMYCTILHDLDHSELLILQILKEKLEIREISSHKGCEEFISSFSNQWTISRNAVESRLIDRIVQESCISIGAVTEIPRLYRRTNRSAPNKKSDYIDNILLPILSLKEVARNSLWERIGERICTQIFQRYNAQVQEVLVSVQRMEESLKRLKKVKGQNQQQNKSGALSDDDKIRQQIQIDIEHLVSQMKDISPKLDTLIIPLQLTVNTNNTSGKNIE